MKKILFTVILFFAIGHSENNSFRFELIGTQRGLSSGEIYSIYQDKAGHLWIGTTDGLNLYDGYTFKVFKPKPFDKNTVSEGFFGSLTEDHEGNIWAGTVEDGINKVDPYTQTISRYRFKKGDSASLPNDQIIAMCVDRKNTLWIITGLRGIVRCDLATMRFTLVTSVITDQGIQQLPFIRSIFEDHNGVLWWGTTDGRLIRYDAHIQSAKFISTPEYRTGSSFSVNTFCEDSAGIIWIGTNNGLLYSFDPVDEKFTQIPFRVVDRPNRKNIFTLKNDAAGNIWIASNVGVFRYSPYSKILLSIAELYGLSNPGMMLSARTLFIDRSDLVWIGTSIDGLLKIASLPEEILNLRSDKTPSKGLPDNYVRGVYDDNHGTIWIGTMEGVTRFDVNKKRFFPLNRGIQTTHRSIVKNIHAVCGDSAGNIWIGSGNDGLFRYTPSLKKGIHVLGSGSQSSDSRDDHIFDLRTDDHGFIWVSTEAGGVVQLNHNGKILHRFDTTSHVLPLNMVRVTLPDKDGIIWVGTFGAGLCKIDRNAKKSFVYKMNPNNPHSLTNDLILDLFKDSKGRLWIGTRIGLNLFDPSTATFTHYTTENGLPNDIIVGIREDSRKNLWIATYDGISKFDGTNFHNFYGADGFQDDLFNTGASFTSKSGRLMFGGVRGLSLFNPDNLHIARFVPPIIITASKQIGKFETVKASQFREASITLGPNEQSVTFEFSALDFRLPEGNSYSYKLEGFDQQWIFSGKRRSVSYANLRGGTYLFKVKAAGRDGVWLEAKYPIVLEVIPPLRNRWWFVPSIGLGIIAVLFLFYRTLMYRKIEFEKVRTRIASDLHDEIGSGLARIAVLSDIIDTQSKEIPSVKGRKKQHSMTEAPSRIGVISRELMESISDVVWSVDPKNDPSERLIERVISYATQLCEEKDIGISVEMTSLESLTVEPFLKRAILLIVKESMTNIIKHSRCKKVIIRMEHQGAELCMTISDDGKGFDEKNLERINGLDNMRRRASESGGTIDIVSTPGSGTSITARFPLSKKLL